MVSQSWCGVGGFVWGDEYVKDFKPVSLVGGL